MQNCTWLSDFILNCEHLKKGVRTRRLFNPYKTKCRHRHCLHGTYTHTHFLVVVANGSDNIQFHSIWIGNILLEFLFYSRELLRLFAVHFNSKIPFDSFFSFVELPRYIVTTNYFISSLLNFSRNCCLLQRSQIRSTLEKSLPYD